VTLGSQAVKILPPDFLGWPGPMPVGYIWKAVGVPAGMFLWLLAFWFCALSTVSVLFGIRQMKFNLSWWAFIFPNAGLTIAAIQIGNAIGSKAIGKVCSVATVLLVIVWFGVAIGNIWAVYNRKILWPGMDEDMEDVEGHSAEDMLENEQRT
jgi:tellurite resistance protein TehA-like permease